MTTFAQEEFTLGDVVTPTEGDYAGTRYKVIGYRDDDPFVVVVECFATSNRFTYGVEDVVLCYRP